MPVLGTFKHPTPYTNFHELNADWLISKCLEFDNVPEYVNQIIMKAIQEGTIHVALTYDADTEALTLSVTP